jgi:hypothetical protein
MLKKLLLLSLVVVSMTSCYTTSTISTAKYSMSLLDSNNTKVDTATVMTYKDSVVDIYFEFKEKDVAFGIKNKTNKSIKLVWDEALFMANGSSSKVMHDGVKYINRNESMPPTVIPANTFISDVITPTSNVYWREGYYSQYGSTPGGWEQSPLLDDKLEKDSKVQIYLPMIIGGQTKEYNFTFNVENKNTYLNNKKELNSARTILLVTILTLIPLTIMMSSGGQ